MLASLYEARTLASSSRATKNHLTTLTDTNAAAAAAVEADHELSRSGDQRRVLAAAVHGAFDRAGNIGGAGAMAEAGPRAAPADGRWRARCALQLAAFAGATAAFTAVAYRVRHRPRDIAFLAVTYWLVALLLCLVEKLEALRLDASPPARETELRRVRLGVWAVAVTLGNTVAWRVCDAMPFLALKLGVWGVTLVVLGFAYYFVFRSKAGECHDEEHGHPSS